MAWSGACSPPLNEVNDLTRLFLAWKFDSREMVGLWSISESKPTLSGEPRQLR